MPCFHPLSAWQNIDGKVIFGDHVGDGQPIQVPCGQCIGCRLERSRQWAMRLVHEASLHDDNCFITLTYDDFKLPMNHPAITSGSLYKKDYQLFMKRLRRKYPDKKIKFYQCGEYGDKNNRPHYHAILFGHNFDDWVYLFDSPSGEPIYTSPTLENIWSHGFVTIGTVSFESAGYVARYCLKKITGLGVDEIDETTGLKPYERVHSFTGEIVEVVPEYSTMSRGGTNGRGIAYDWIDTYSSSVYPKDFTTIRGARMRPPKYYDKYIEAIDPSMYDDIKQGRKEIMYSLEQENSPLRLSQKEVVKEAQFKQLIRSL